MHRGFQQSASCGTLTTAMPSDQLGCALTAVLEICTYKASTARQAAPAKMQWCGAHSKEAPRFSQSSAGRVLIRQHCAQVCHHPNIMYSHARSAHQQKHAYRAAHRLCAPGPPWPSFLLFSRISQLFTYARPVFHVFPAKDGMYGTYTGNWPTPLISTNVCTGLCI
eukprot:987629-Pelagomonas_calceolata.AAC.3